MVPKYTQFIFKFTIKSKEEEDIEKGVWSIEGSFAL